MDTFRIDHISLCCLDLELCFKVIEANEHDYEIIKIS